MYCISNTSPVILPSCKSFCNYWNLILQTLIYNVYTYLYTSCTTQGSWCLACLLQYWTWITSVTLTGAAEAKRKLCDDWKSVRSCSRGGEAKCCNSTNTIYRSVQHAAILTSCGCSLTCIITGHIWPRTFWKHKWCPCVFRGQTRARKNWNGTDQHSRHTAKSASNFTGEAA